MLKYVVGVTKNVVFNTGNVLNYERKPARDELLDSLVHACERHSEINEEPVGQDLYINKNDAGMLQLNVPERRSSVKATLKVFLATCKDEFLKEALDAAFAYLKSPFIETVILASHPKCSLSGLMKAWIVLEEYVQQGKVFRLGLTDVNADVFVSLLDWALVKPSIYQCNLADRDAISAAMVTCAKKHRVQMETHVDSLEILRDADVENVLLEGETERWNFTFAWATRIKIHQKRGGGLCYKSYIVCLKDL